MKILISDLDSTLIYPKCDYKDKVCIEQIRDVSMTFMTKKAHDDFLQLLKNKDFIFIPCTLRSFEETKWIDIIDREKSIMICDGGATIYEKGEKDKEWENHINSLIDKNEINNYIKEIEKLNLDIKIKNHNNNILFINFNNKQEREKSDYKIINLINKEKYEQYSFGRKLLIKPKILDKSIAVKYIKEKYKFEEIITTGDNFFDEKFVKLGDYQIIPNHALFYSKNKTKNKGILAGEEIVNYIKNIV